MASNSSVKVGAWASPSVVPARRRENRAAQSSLAVAPLLVVAETEVPAEDRASPRSGVTVFITPGTPFPPRGLGAGGGVAVAGFVGRGVGRDVLDERGL